MKLESKAHTLFFTAVFGGISKFIIEVLYTSMGATLWWHYMRGGGSNGFFTNIIF